jgi:hypothetical protein
MTTKTKHICDSAGRRGSGRRFAGPRSAPPDANSGCCQVSERDGLAGRNLAAGKGHPVLCAREAPRGRPVGTRSLCGAPERHGQNGSLGFRESGNHHFAIEVSRGLRESTAQRLAANSAQSRASLRLRDGRFRPQCRSCSHFSFCGTSKARMNFASFPMVSSSD